MESVNTAIKLLFPCCFMAAIDLKDAYYHVPIHRDYQKFLRVAVYVQGCLRHYQYAALPFGLSIAPRIFTKLMSDVMFFLRSQNVVIVPYLDDFLIIGNSAAHCMVQIKEVITTLERLEWKINLAKLRLTPELVQSFLGLVLDSTRQLCLLPENKLVKIQNLGKGIVVTEAVRFAQFHARPLQLALWSSSRMIPCFYLLRATGMSISDNATAKTYINRQGRTRSKQVKLESREKDKGRRGPYILDSFGLAKKGPVNMFMDVPWKLPGRPDPLALKVPSSSRVHIFVKALTIHDTRHCETWDLGTNFFIREDDITNKKNRAEACLRHVEELNPYVQVISSTIPLDESSDLSFLKQFQCVILTEARLSMRTRINNFCHDQQPPIKFICSDSYGVCSYVFCDFGDEFQVFDTTGEEPKEIFISNITQSNPGVVTCFDNRPHNLESGQFMTFREVNGMTSLNGSTHQITVTSPYSFSVGDTSDMDPYEHGGLAVQVKMPQSFTFERLEKQLMNPKYLIADFSKLEAPLSIHAAMLALDHFQEKHGRLPNIR
ncbi:unnamed protein product [Ranitomeya imitator]|uniref:ribonuclease H n=1 Tax=Ranitomeya imitator TaxID=111125 RepID=A0ABN9MJ54_9NEOB|nr:unnamed protein product [Ranitomeya imitator]